MVRLGNDDAGFVEWSDAIFMSVLSYGGADGVGGEEREES